MAIMAHVITGQPTTGLMDIIGRTTGTATGGITGNII
jgi:hypothetical protein